MQEFVNKKGLEFKKELLEQAQRELKKIENKRKVLEAELARKEKDARIAAEQRAKGILPETMEADGTLGIGWSRGVKVQPEVRDREEAFIRGAVSAKADNPPATISRAAFGKGTVEPRPDDRKEEMKRPTFSKGKAEDAGGFGLSRSGMGTSKTEDTKTSVAASASGSSGFNRGAGAP